MSTMVVITGVADKAGSNFNFLSKRGRIIPNKLETKTTTQIANPTIIPIITGSRSRTTLKKPTNPSNPPKRLPINDSVMTVSYTHLDVYKRQAEKFISFET